MNNVHKWGLHLGLLHLWSTVWVYLDLRTLRSFVFVSPGSFASLLCVIRELSAILHRGWAESVGSLLCYDRFFSRCSGTKMWTKCRGVWLIKTPGICSLVFCHQRSYVPSRRLTLFLFLVFVFFFSRWTFFVQFCPEVQGDIGTGLYVPCEVYHLPVPASTLTKDSRNTTNFMPYFSRL